MNEQTKALRSALRSADPGANGASTKLADLTAADWANLDPATRALADRLLDHNLTSEFTGRQARAAALRAAANRAAAEEL